MKDETLMHLIYSSAAASEFDSSNLKSILEAARKKNSPRRITGILLYTSGSFFQVLEGDQESVNKLFTTIEADDRHENVTLIIREPIASRSFADWSMGFIAAEQNELEGVDGFSDLFLKGDLPQNLMPGRASKILQAFTQGRWRARLDGASK